MLVLSRKLGQQIRIGDDITVTIIKTKGNTVRVGIEAPKTVRVVRAELPPLPLADDARTSETADGNRKTFAGTATRETRRDRRSILPLTEKLRPTPSDTSSETNGVVERAQEEAGISPHPDRWSVSNMRQRTLSRSSLDPRAAGGELRDRRSAGNSVQMK